MVVTNFNMVQEENSAISSMANVMALWDIKVEIWPLGIRDTVWSLRRDDEPGWDHEGGTHR